MGRVENCVDIKPVDGGPVERYCPRWLGGMPAKGGGPDKKAIEKIRQLKKGDRVTVKFEYDERLRLVDVKTEGHREHGGERDKPHKAKREDAKDGIY